MCGHASPEEAAAADDSIPAQYVKVLAVDYSPREDMAVVLIEYNEPPMVEPYVVLCQRTDDGWDALQGGSSEGSSWMRYDEDRSLGVEVLWGSSTHRTEWDVPGPSDFDGAIDSGHGDW
jgi:hypothetical protein